MRVVDVRTKQEYEQGHVDGSLWFDVERLITGEMPDLPKEEEIVLYCRSGARSSTAMYIMQEHGFANVTSGGSLAAMVARGHKLTHS